MNIETKLAAQGAEAPPSMPTAVKLTVDDFLLLKQSGVFAGFSKAELLWGELSGVPLQDEDEPESDASIPIKLRVQDYLLLDEAGAFEPYRKTELIDGVVYEVSPQGRRHMFVKDELAYRLRRALEDIGSNLFVGTEGSVELKEHSLPEPDILLTSEPRGDGFVPAASVPLMIEVSDTTLRLDLERKAGLYARHGVPEYWVIDREGARIVQHWRPGATGYAERRSVALGERVEAVTIAGLAVETGGI